MVANCNVHLKVISGHELPKTDLFSQIDPYVVVSFTGAVLGRTAKRGRNANPVWQEDFFFEVEQDEDGLHGNLVLDLYDEEGTKDEHVGSVLLDLQSLTPEMLFEPLQLPVSFKKDKRGQKLARSAPRARIALQVVAVGKPFSSYVSELADAETAIVDERSGTVLVPVLDTDETLWAGLRFSPRSTQILLLTTADPKASRNPAVWYDVSYSGLPSLRVERLHYRKPVKMLGLKVWNELRATNVPLDAKLSKIRIVEREHRLVDTLDAADVLVGHGYMIGMPFLAAVKELSRRPTVHVDAAAQAIWIKMDDNEPQPAQLLQLDYGGNAADVEAAAAAADAARETSPGGSSAAAGAGGGKETKGRDGGKFPALRICSTSSELNKGYELAFFSDGGRAAAGPMVTVSEAFRRAKPILGGLYDIVHTVELRGAFVGDALEEIGLGCYEVMKASRTWRLGKLLDAAARGELRDIDEAGCGAGGGSVHGHGRAATDGADGGSGVGGTAGLARRWLSWLPCMAPPRVDGYRMEGQAEAGSQGEAGSKKQVSTANSRTKQQEVQEARRGANRRQETSRSPRGGGGGEDRGGAGGALSNVRAKSCGSGGGGGNRTKSGGDGNGAVLAAPPLQKRSPSFGAGSGTRGTFTSGGEAASAGGGGSRASQSHISATTSVGSSSGRSASLAAYNSTKNKYSSNTHRRGNGGIGDKLRSSTHSSSRRSVRTGVRAGSDEVDDDN